MSTNWILIFILTILVVLSIFVPNIPSVADSVSVMTNTTLPSEPSPWDVLTFNGSFIWSCMTFTYDSEFPYFLGMMFWFMSFGVVYCVARLVRGTS